MPVALTRPVSNARRQSLRVPSSASPLKTSRRISRRTFASRPRSFVTVTSGSSRRNCWTSPRPCRSIPTTSFSGLSAGTSSSSRFVVLVIIVRASPDIPATLPAHFTSTFRATIANPNDRPITTDASVCTRFAPPRRAA